MRIEAHFDESGTTSNELTLAGYLFEADRIDEFCSMWKMELEKFGLPYFHMVDCAHGSKPFDKMEKIERVRLQMILMKLIKRFTVNGIICNVSNDAAQSGERYEKAAKLAAGLAIEWANKAAYSGKITYIFESGARGQNLVDGWFHEVSDDPSNMNHYRYAGHAFVSKANSPGVQAADLLAWQYHNFTKKRAEKNLARLDLRALLRHPHCISDECGDPPRGSSIQSVKASRSRTETVYYLPRATKKQIKHGSVIFPRADFTPLKGHYLGVVLACPNCFRAIAEGVGVTQVRNIVLRCWCETYCIVPDQMSPLTSY